MVITFFFFFLNALNTYKQNNERLKEMSIDISVNAEPRREFAEL